jgi:hypothetical protein
MNFIINVRTEHAHQTPEHMPPDLQLRSARGNRARGLAARTVSHFSNIGIILLYSNICGDEAICVHAARRAGLRMSRLMKKRPAGEKNVLYAQGACKSLSCLSSCSMNTLFFALLQ